MRALFHHALERSQRRRIVFGFVAERTCSEPHEGVSHAEILSDRRATIAWERKEDFLELFRANGCVYNSVGQPVIRGRIMLVYDRGVFIGHFTTFEEAEDSDHPYSFQLSWEFKIEHAIYRLPTVASKTSGPDGLFTKAQKPSEGR